MPPNLPELLFLAGIGLWVGIGLLVSRLGGWSILAESYRCTSEFRGDMRRLQSARMRWGTNYGSCLNIGAGYQGLYLSVIFLFRLGHPPLLIPWSDISVRTERGRWFPYVEFRFRRAPAIPLRVSEQLGQWLTSRASSLRQEQILPAHR